jgi:hypothetical protein
MITRVILHTVTAVFIIPYSNRTELLIKQESSYGTIISQLMEQEEWSKLQELKREREKDIRTVKI